MNPHRWHIINEVLGASGAGQTFRVGYERDDEGKPVLGDDGQFRGGTDYTLSPVTQRVKAGFEKWMVGIARQKVLEEQGSVPADVFAEMMAKFADRKAAGHYGWGGPVWRAVFSTPEGLCELFYLLTRQHHPDVLRDVIAPQVEQHAEDVLLAVGEMVAAGNPQALRKLKEGLAQRNGTTTQTPSPKSAAP